MIKTTVSEDGIVADFFHDNTGQPRKAVILLGGSEGGKVWSRLKQIPENLIKRGFCALSLAYFKAPGLPDSLEEIPLEYFEKAFDWLGAQPGVIPDEYAVLGGSKGAEAGLVLGSRYPRVKAVVGFMPSSVVWQGIPKNRFRIGKDPKSSWSYMGKALPYVPSSLTKKDIGALLMLNLRKSAIRDLQNEERVAEARIPVERIQGAILLLSARRDRLWPSTDMSEQVVKRLKDSDFDHPYVHIPYDTGHGGMLRDRQCWRGVFDFLEDHFA
jgi:dienelactone hydrolase